MWIWWISQTSENRFLSRRSFPAPSWQISESPWDPRTRWWWTSHFMNAYPTVCFSRGRLSMSERRVLLKVEVCYTSSHLHIFSSSQTHTFISSYLHIFTFSQIQSTDDSLFEAKILELENSMAGAATAAWLKGWGWLDVERWRKDGGDEDSSCNSKGKTMS